MTAGAKIEALGSLRLSPKKAQTKPEQILEVAAEHKQGKQDKQDEHVEHDVPCAALSDAGPLCQICWSDETEWKRSECCGVIVCNLCFAEYLERKVTVCAARIECPNCDKSVAKRLVLQMLEDNGRTQARDEYVRQMRGDKKCPRCAAVLPQFEGRECPQCSLEWCFRCEASHGETPCDLYVSSHRTQLKSWAKSVTEGQWNAQKCPRCKIYIQRASGCDHMNCVHCQTQFCYRCGGRLLHMKFFGDHYSKLSVFGCKYKYKPNKPIQRKLIRSIVFIGRLVAIPLAGVGALCGLTVFAILAAPMYFGYHLHKHVISWIKRRSRDREQPQQQQQVQLQPQQEQQEQQQQQQQQQQQNQPQQHQPEEEEEKVPEGKVQGDNPSA